MQPGVTAACIIWVHGQQKNRVRSTPRKLRAACTAPIAASNIGDTMPDERTDGTLTARSSEPVTRPYEVGLSSRVKEQLGKIGINKEIKARIETHLQKKAG
jgi:hypothetical protein